MGRNFDRPGARGRRRKRRREYDAGSPDANIEFRSHRRGRRNRWDTEEEATPERRWRRAEPENRPTTCLECINLVIARSRAKAIGDPWENAVVYPSYSCYEQQWTVDDPDSARDLSEVSPYLVGEAERCPDFLRGSARDFRRGYWW